MSLWGNKDQANNAVKFMPIAGSNATGNVVFGNTTPGAFNHARGVIAGLFGVDQTEATVAGKGVTQGWVLRKKGLGPVTGVTATGGAGIANGETVKLSNGSSNGVLTLVSNATSNLASAVITNGGLFEGNTTVVATFNREKHLSTVDVTSNATAIGYTNGDVITASNGVINATATITTNATGGITSTTVTNPGLFGNTQANTTVVFTVSNSTGGATSGNVASTGFAANLAASTGGSITITTVGGRAGRVQYETLAVVRNMTNSDADAEDTIFPDA